MLRYSHHAMACKWEIICWGLPEETLLAAAEQAFSVVDSLEERLSIYRPGSDINRINAQAAESPVEVAADVYQLLERAKMISEWTKGAFDVTSGGLVRLWGFQNGAYRKPRQEEIDEVLKCTGTHHLMLDVKRLSVSYDRPGVEINLGAFGKGHAVDCAVETLRRIGTPGALVHSGLSTIYGLGTAPDGAPWQARIRSPREAGRAARTVPLQNCALSTSGDYEQFFEVDGARYSHVLDPRTGWPVTGTLSASVIAESAASSDALSTAAMVLGRKRFLEIAKDEPGVQAVAIVCADGRDEPEERI